ncbi:MAG: hypothetical protein LIO79_10590 [Rikenellaceae bacterium]|nr:hypothetical protein [Rikenellaceae bacterium]
MTTISGNVKINALSYAGGYYGAYIDDIEFIGEDTTTPIPFSGSTDYSYTAPGGVYEKWLQSINVDLPEVPQKIRFTTGVYSIDNPYLYFDVTVNILNDLGRVIASQRVMIKDDNLIEIDLSDAEPASFYTISLDITPDLSYGHYSQLVYYCSVIDLDYTEVSRVNFTVDIIEFNGGGDINSDWPAYEWLYGETKSQDANTSAVQIYMFDQQAPILFPTLKSITSKGRITTDIPVNFIDLEIRIHGTNQVLYSEKFANLSSTTTWEYAFDLDLSELPIQQKYEIAILAAVQ